MRIYKSLSILLIFLFISCKQNEEKKSLPEKKDNFKISKTENINIEPKTDINILIENFRDFRNAVYQKNKVKVKRFIDFPIYNENNEIWYLENIANEEFLKKLTEKITPFPESEFDKHFDKIFTKLFISGILKIKSEILFNEGEYETIELTEKNTKYKIYANYYKKSNEIVLNLTTVSPIKVNDGENEIIEKSEYNVIYYFKIENGENIKFKQIRIAG
ncbi:hypothetical protein [Flavobacterium difficile]|uniref:Lipoprotein n=1 Tax=Flavobacterium difficile TaxID=2709659 RepID=A0ABX0I6S8_9FLAO|nr:hypothetical protein [Flavobacterium difficile]NHM02841.1 hypothetical protein [Flavobacterium difficile]